MQYRNIHLIGAGGIGLSALGKLFLLQGVSVSGSDMVKNDEGKALESLGATIHLGHMASNISDEVDLIVYSTAVPEDNPERVEAKKRGVEQVSYPEMLGRVAKEYKTIAVTGTHGKSTTTAMIGHILVEAGLDPTVIVGSKMPNWEHGNLRKGQSNILVVEACEHMANMLHIHPDIGVITNVEADHLDFYKDVDAIISAMTKFADQSELTILNADDIHSKTTASNTMTKTQLVGSEYISSRSLGSGVQSAQFDLEGTTISVELSVPGQFNLQNALVASVVALELGVDPNEISQALKSFDGIWRRFERIGVWNGADIINDYAHHPTAIQATLEAAREFFPNRRIVLCFEPHQHSRTKELFDEFVSSFDNADVVILPEIYRVSGRTEDETISSKDLVKAIEARDHSDRNIDRVIKYAEDLDSAKLQLMSFIKPQDVLILMGAGTIDSLARSIELETL